MTRAMAQANANAVPAHNWGVARARTPIQPTFTELIHRALNVDRDGSFEALAELAKQLRSVNPMCNHAAAERAALEILWLWSEYLPPDDAARVREVYAMQNGFAPSPEEAMRLGEWTAEVVNVIGGSPLPAIAVANANKIFDDEFELFSALLGAP